MGDVDDAADALRRDDLAPIIATARRAVADLLDGLDEQQLSTPSLCAGWDVRTVAAHLACAAEPAALRSFARDLLAARGRVHRANDAAARRAARRPVADVAAALRANADRVLSPPVTGPRGPLTDVLVHDGDIRLPLGMPLTPDPEAVRLALDFVTTGRPVGFVPRGRLRGVRLVPTDVDGAWGGGPEIRGRGIHLLMAACGRTAVLDRLEGAGVGMLAGR